MDVKSQSSVVICRNIQTQLTRYWELSTDSSNIGEVIMRSGVIRGIYLFVNVNMHTSQK